jgi:hypothetical protein
VKDFPAALAPLALLEPAEAALLLSDDGEALLAEDESEAGLPFTSTCSPTCEDSLEVSPVNL